MNTQILIVTYANDVPYLELNLRTINKFAKGFSGTTLVVPSDELSLFVPLTQDFGVDLSQYHRPRNKELWHLSAQAQKCWADGHCRDADFILHTDSDCAFTETVTPDDYFVNGKPIMLYESYDKLPGVPWRPVVEAVLKTEVPNEFMRRHPQVNPIGVYSDLRRHIQNIHNTPFTKFVESRKASFPWGFTEHNVIGAFAFSDDRWKDKYHWHEVAVHGVPKEKLVQFWSHSDPDVPQEISHGGSYTPRQFVTKLVHES